MLKSMAERTTTVLTGLPKSKDSKGFEYYTDKLIDLQDEINGDIARCVNARRKAQEAINKVENETYRTLLEYRYLCGKTLEEIAELMNYEPRNTYYLYKKALFAIQKIE